MYQSCPRTTLLSLHAYMGVCVREGQCSAACICLRKTIGAHLDMHHMYVCTYKIMVYIHRHVYAGLGAYVYIVNVVIRYLHIYI